MAQRILLVEDAKNIILSVKMCLQDEGWEVSVATDGVTAIKKAFEEHPDLILLDIILPELNGYHVCEALKADERTQSIPIVIISAQGQRDIKRALDLGAVDYLAKPFQVHELVETVERFIKRAT